jgi:hypothetical protein
MTPYRPASFDDLASFSRLIVFDRRRTGASDGFPWGGAEPAAPRIASRSAVGEPRNVSSADTTVRTLSLEHRSSAALRASAKSLCQTPRMTMAPPADV